VDLNQSNGRTVYIAFYSGWHNSANISALIFLKKILQMYQHECTGLNVTVYGVKKSFNVEL
jgi:hypothetical protein